VIYFGKHEVVAGVNMIGHKDSVSEIWKQNRAGYNRVYCNRIRM
jgi:hypothetical protein